MLLRQMLKSKIHRATITEANVDYVGSITIDADLMRRVDLLAGEHVHIWNITNGERFETYVIEGPAGSGVVCINGAAALRVAAGQKIIIASFAMTDTPIVAKVILVDDQNRFVQDLPQG